MGRTYGLLLPLLAVAPLQVSANAQGSGKQTVTLRLAPKDVACLLKHSSEIPRVKTPLVIIAPAYCPVIPFKDYDPELLARDSSSDLPVAYVFSKKRALCVLNYLKDNRGRLLKGHPTRALEVTVGC